MLGYKRQDVIGRTVKDLDIWTEPAQRFEMFRHLTAGGRLTGFRIRCNTSKKRDPRIGTVCGTDRTGWGAVPSGYLLGYYGNPTVGITVAPGPEDGGSRFAGRWRCPRLQQSPGVILGYSDLILDGIPLDDPRSKQLEQIKKAGLRATSLTRQLLAFSRKQIFQPRILNINTL